MELAWIYHKGLWYDCDDQSQSYDMGDRKCMCGYDKACVVEDNSWCDVREQGVIEGGQGVKERGQGVIEV